MEHSYNTRAPAVRRLLREAKEMVDNPSPYCYATPLEDNLFEWHFVIAGPEDTEFHGGLYHGRIILPADYPLKPPSIIVMTPNGRFETNKRICLSISGYHPETWLPSWSIRTALLALVGFMPTPAQGAIGSLSYSADERKRLARLSRNWRCRTCELNNCEFIPPMSDQDSTRTEADKQEAKRLGAQIRLTPEKAKPDEAPPAVVEESSSTLPDPAAAASKPTAAESVAETASGAPPTVTTATTAATTSASDAQDAATMDELRRRQRDLIESRRREQRRLLQNMLGGTSNSQNSAAAQTTTAASSDNGYWLFVFAGVFVIVLLLARRFFLFLDAA